jgi:hypothetical protein
MEIRSFVDFFTDHYSLPTLIVACIVLGVVWCCSVCCSFDGNRAPLLSCVELFFDITSAAANSRVKTGPNIVHAIGSLVHACGAAFRLSGNNGEPHSSAAFAAALFFSFPGEVLELGAISAALEGWRVPACICVLILGSFVTFLMAFVFPAGDNEDEHSKRIYVVVGYGFQAIYAIVVIIAATEDWRRLLWILPEFPVKTITLSLSVVFGT